MSETPQMVMVVGPGRSGTSVLASVLGELGYKIPQPEVPADETNPRGFGEPAWLVDFHKELLKKSIVENADARPAAFLDALAAPVGVLGVPLIDLRQQPCRHLAMYAAWLLPLAGSTVHPASTKAFTAAAMSLWSFFAAATVATIQLGGWKVPTTQLRRRVGRPPSSASRLTFHHGHPLPKRTGDVAGAGPRWPVTSARVVDKCDRTVGPRGTRDAQVQNHRVHGSGRSGSVVSPTQAT